MTAALRPGYCGVTELGGDCHRGDSGSWRLCPAHAQPSENRSHDELHSALAACLERCHSCARCRHVSFSVAHADCSWFASCPARLGRKVGGFYTVEAFDPRSKGAVASAAAAFAGRRNSSHFETHSGRQATFPAAKVVGLRVLVAFYGALGRGLLLAGPSLQEKLVGPLRSAAFVRSVHVLCAGLDAMQIDGVRACGEHARELLGCNEYLSQPEAEVWSAAAARCNASRVTCTYSHFWYKRALVVRRASVQLHQENRVALYLKTHFKLYDLVVCSSPDLYLARNVVLADFLHVASARGRVVLTGGTNDWFGYQNGFYVGKPRDVAAITARFDDAALYRRKWIDYEGQLRSAFEHHGVRRRVTPLFFFKVRATCELTMHADPEKLTCTPELDELRRRLRRLLHERSRASGQALSCSCLARGASLDTLYDLHLAARPLHLRVAMEARQDNGTIWFQTQALGKDANAPPALRSTSLQELRRGARWSPRVHSPREGGGLGAADANWSARWRTCPILRPWEKCDGLFSAHPPSRAGLPALPAFEARAMLNRLRGRRLTFVGDSTNVQFAAAFACALYAADPASLREYQLHFKPRPNALRKRCGDTPLNKCHWQSACMTFETVRFCVCGAWRIGQPRACLEDHGSLDVVVYAPTALHWAEMRRDFAGNMSRAASEEARGVLEAVGVGRLRRPAMLIWREATAQHFAPAGGHYEHVEGQPDYSLHRAHAPPCVDHTLSEMRAHQHPWNGVANAIVDASGVPVLKVWEASALAGAESSHLGFGDCTHFCQGPGSILDNWVPLLASEITAALARSSRAAAQQPFNTTNGRCALGARKEPSMDDCASNGAGWWPLRGTDGDSWPEALAACQDQCASCSSCQFLTVSIGPNPKCEWFASCDLGRLAATRKGAYRTMVAAYGKREQRIQ